MLGEPGEVTFRATGTWRVAPGQIATLLVERTWTWRGDDYASGTIEDAKVDIAKLGLTPLPLEGGELEDMRAAYEPYRRPDPYAPLWRKLTAKPRPAFEMDGIAWGAFPDADPEDNPTCDAAELMEMGDRAGAYELLMDTVHRDLRCLDAHGHLGNFAFDHSPERAIVHYEIGMRIGELSLPADFDGVLPWGLIYNRPYLRCLHGYGLCLWRAGRTEEARVVFERILSLNPNDNQGVRFCWQDVKNGLTWEASAAAEEQANGVQ
ncbi:MAG: tetratricopeptide repeat protein [Deltaproteobacteria bacterium]|nr:tetratricopeptide repeat protein [Deltaproteobacteria bacterium]